MLRGTGRPYLLGLVLCFTILNSYAQVSSEQVRSSDTIIYFLDNPNGDNVEIIWDINGGNIIGHSSPYIDYGADTIKVLWNGSNKTDVNYGSLSVQEIFHWPVGPPCDGGIEQINVESWVHPKAQTDNSGLIICPNEPFSIHINFEGKPGYKYKWHLVDIEDSSIILQDNTTEFLLSPSPSADIPIDGIENNTGDTINYVFEMTDVQDGLDDGMPGNISMAKCSIYVLPKKVAGIITNDKHLIRR